MLGARVCMHAGHGPEPNQIVANTWNVFHAKAPLRRSCWSLHTKLQILHLSVYACLAQASGIRYYARSLQFKSAGQSHVARIRSQDKSTSDVHMGDTRTCREEGTCFRRVAKLQCSHLDSIAQLRSMPIMSSVCDPLSACNTSCRPRKFDPSFDLHCKPLRAGRPTWGLGDLPEPSGKGSWRRAS